MIDASVTGELRQLARDGRRPSELLRHAAAREGMEEHANIPVLFRHLQTAFGLTLRDVHLVGGWGLDGAGEVPDSRLDAELGEKVNGWVRSHPAESASHNGTDGGGKSLAIDGSLDAARTEPVNEERMGC